MDPRIPRIRRKLARVQYLPTRSHSFGEESHRFRLGRRLSPARITAFEAVQSIRLPTAYRDFLLHIGGSGAGPFYGLLPLDRCSLLTMDPPREGRATRSFGRVDAQGSDSDLFLNIAEAGCSDLVLLTVTGPMTGRVMTGNADGFWGPQRADARDFLAWYEQWLDYMADGRDDRAVHLTSPALAAACRRSPDPPAKT
jgi:hypothetical protein